VSWGVTGLATNPVGNAAPPIFIVGSPRSGTSLMRLILDSHPSIACGPETHLLSDFDDSLGKHWVRLQRYGAEKEFWHGAYAELFGRFQADYAARRGKTRWADKTPSHALHLEFVTTLFPDAQVLHVIRDARQVTASALSRWGWRRAWGMPEIWRGSVEMASTYGRGVEPGRYREIRFEQLVGATEETLKGVFDWLGESWDPRVLDYDRFEHDGRGRNQKVSSAARKRGGGAIDVGHARRPSHPLDPVLAARTERIAGALNRRLGYL
jgi:sulfotransferase family protein